MSADGERVAELLKRRRESLAGRDFSDTVEIIRRMRDERAGEIIRRMRDGRAECGDQRPSGTPSRPAHTSPRTPGGRS